MALDAGPLRPHASTRELPGHPPRRTAAPSERVRVRRVHEKASYDRDAVEAILDEALVAHLGFAHEGQPFVIPTLHARLGEEVYVHGSSASRTLRALGGALPVCLTVTLLDGLVFARSVFEMSANYRSVVILGEARRCRRSGREARGARGVLRAGACPAAGRRRAGRRGRSSRRRRSSRSRSTRRRRRSRTGGPDDGETEDAALPVWAGHVPLQLVAGEPVPCPHLRPGIPVPAEIAGYSR